MHLKTKNFDVSSPTYKTCNVLIAWKMFQNSCGVTIKWHGHACLASFSSGSKGIWHGHADFWHGRAWFVLQVGHTWFSPRKVYLKYWGKSLKSTFGGFMIDGGVGSVFGNWVWEKRFWCLRYSSSWGVCTCIRFSIYSNSSQFANLLHWLHSHIHPKYKL